MLQPASHKKFRSVRKPRRGLPLFVGLFLGLSVLTAAVVTGKSSLAPAAQAQEEAEPFGVPYRGEILPAVDMHLHPGSYKSLGPLGKAFILDALPEFLPDFLKELSLRASSSLLQNPYGAFIGIKNQCLKSGFRKCGLFAVHAPETWGVVSPETIQDWLEDKKNINPNTGEPLYFGLTTVDMTDWEQHAEARLEKLERELRTPYFKGIKLAFIHNSIPLDDPQYDGIYEVAARTGAPVYHHVGSSPLRQLDDFGSDEERERYIRSYDPQGLERAIAAYPNVTFIMGHMGFDFNQEGFAFDEVVFELAHAYPNTVLEVSAFGGSIYDPDGRYKDNVFRRIKEEGLLPRTIYGSDGPGAPGGIGRYLNEVLPSIDRVGYTVEEARMLLNDNSTRIFRL